MIWVQFMCFIFFPHFQNIIQNIIILQNMHL